MIPAKYQSKGLLWWRGQLSVYLFRPNGRVQQWLDSSINIEKLRGLPNFDILETVAALGLSGENEQKSEDPTNCEMDSAVEKKSEFAIALQVRRGDKVRESAIHEFNDYFTYASEISKKWLRDSKTIYLATDDGDLKSKAREEEYSSKYDIYFFENDREEDMEKHKQLQGDIKTGMYFIIEEVSGV